MNQESSRENQFYEAAEPLFERFGFRKTTVEEICRAAGASKRTFYELFTDKADFFFHMFMHIANCEIRTWRESLSAELDPLQKLESFLDAYIDVGKRHPIFGYCLLEVDVHECISKHSRVETYQPMVDALSNVIAEGVADGTFRELDPEIAVWIIDALMDNIYYIMPQMTGKPGAFEDENLAAEARAFIINGLSA